MKVFLDGGMLNGTAYMREPWGVGETYQITEPDYRGLLFIEPDTLATIAQEAARRGWQMTAHCAGEAGMDQLLAAYLHADRDRGNSPPPLADHSCQLHFGGQPQALHRARCRGRSSAGLALERHANATSGPRARGAWNGSIRIANGWTPG